jgi:hypothetical protein
MVTFIVLYIATLKKGLVTFIVLYSDNVCRWFVTGRWFSPSIIVSPTYKTDRQDITEYF